MINTQVKEPCDVIALSLGCEFTALAALAHPTLFHSLTCISPTGFDPPKSGSGSQRAAEEESSNQIYALFAFPLWKRSFYDLLVTRRSLEYFLKKSFVGPISTGLVDYGYFTGHQPGAANVPLYFISGKLFTPDVRTRVYEIVHTPTLVLYDRDAYTGFEMLPDLLAKNPNWRAVRITPTRGLPQFEQLHQTVEALEAFWSELG
ncbi:MAG: alpha/beta hydrolase [Chloroflexi bacterium]|nr:alpha/beta hydrolase [Chloroflexota bacterium]